MRNVHLLIIVLATALAACTRPTTVESSWSEGVPRNQTFGKVLVVGVTPNYTTRCRFERMMMDSLNTNGVRSLTSCSRMKSSDPLTRDAVIAAVGESGADAVFATRLVDGKINVKEGGTDEARGEAYVKPVGYGYDSYYGGYGMPVTYVNFVAEAPNTHDHPVGLDREQPLRDEECGARLFDQHHDVRQEVAGRGHRRRHARDRDADEEGWPGEVRDIAHR